MTTKQLIALVISINVIGAVATYLVYGSLLACPMFH
jgi:hypothetical protein